jgi:hypothetical protein
MTSPSTAPEKHVPIRVPRAICLLLLAAAAALGCTAVAGGSDGRCSVGGETNGITVTACTEYEDNALILRLVGSLPAEGDVTVEYGNSEAGWYRTEKATSRGAEFEVYVARLRPETAYDFQVFLDQGGSRVAGPSGSFTTGPLPEALQRVGIKVSEGSAQRDGLVLLDFHLQEFEEEPSFGGLAAMDYSGAIVWYVETGSGSPGDVFTQLANLDIAYIPPTEGVVVISPLGERLDMLEAPCPEHHAFHHEIIPLDDDRILFMSREIRDAFGDPQHLQEGDTIMVWDRSTRQAEEVWNVFDFLDPRVDRTEASDDMEGYMWRGCSGEEPSQDWTHGNAVKPAPDGSWTVSLRHLNQVISIAPDFSSINWRLGGPGSDFTFADPSDQFYHQHSAWQLADGNVVLFDNGNFRPEEEGGEYSRAVELELDLETMTATKVWEYRPQPDLFAFCCSSVDRLENGNTLVVFGSGPDIIPCCHTFTVVEADTGGEAVWRAEISGPGKIIQYRGYPAETILGERPIPGR